MKISSILIIFITTCLVEISLAQTLGDWCTIGKSTFNPTSTDLSDDYNYLNGESTSFSFGKAVVFFVPVTGRNWNLVDVQVNYQRQGGGWSGLAYSFALLKYNTTTSTFTKLMSKVVELNSTGDLTPIAFSIDGSEAVNLHFSSDEKLAIAIKSANEARTNGITGSLTANGAPTFYTFTESFNGGNWSNSFPASLTTSSVYPNIQLNYYPRTYDTSSVSGEKTLGKQIAVSGKQMKINASTGLVTKETTNCYGPSVNPTSLIWDPTINALRVFGN